MSDRACEIHSGAPRWAHRSLTVVTALPYVALPAILRSLCGQIHSYDGVASPECYLIDAQTVMHTYTRSVVTDRVHVSCMLRTVTTTRIGHRPHRQGIRTDVERSNVIAAPSRNPAESARADMGSCPGHRGDGRRHDRPRPRRIGAHAERQPYVYAMVRRRAVLRIESEQHVLLRARRQGGRAGQLRSIIFEIGRCAG